MKPMHELIGTTLVAAGLFVVRTETWGSTCYNLTNAPCTSLTNGASCNVRCPNCSPELHTGTVSSRGSGMACRDVSSGGKTDCLDDTTDCRYTCTATCPLTGTAISSDNYARKVKKLGGVGC